MKYRKKSAIVEAFQYDGDLKGSDGKYYVPKWAEQAFKDGTLYYDEFHGQPCELFINTYGGVHHASIGDYIIRDVNDIIYPCKPNVFEKFYEKIEESEKNHD